MSAQGPTRADTFQVNVQVEDVRHPDRIMLNLGTFDKRGGGQLDSEEYRYNPGGMAPAVSLGGRKTTENITVSRLYRIVRDHNTLAQRLFNGVGRARMVVSQQPLDISGDGEGLRSIVWRGTLKRVTLPEHDSESSDPAMMELEMTVEGEPVIG
jgi:hypothetical protein